MGTSLNNELIIMLSTGKFLYVHSWKWEARALPDIWIRFHVEPNLGSRVEYVQQESSDRGLTPPKFVSPVKLSFVLSCVCKPHISSYLYWHAATKKYSNIGPCSF